MTLRKLDCVLYANARKWLDLIGAVVDPDDKPMLTREKIIDITGRNLPVVIRGMRPGPLAKSQMITQKSSARGSLKKKSVAETKESAVVEGQRIIFVIAPESNEFSKKDDIENVTRGLPIDGTAEIIIASKIVAPQLAGESYIWNIKHDTLAYNPLDHSSAPAKSVSGSLNIEVIREPDVIAKDVLWDTISSDLSSMAKMRFSLDPYAFWLDAHPGDVVRYMLNAEDTVVISEYRHVVK